MPKSKYPHTNVQTDPKKIKLEQKEELAPIVPKISKAKNWVKKDDGVRFKPQLDQHKEHGASIGKREYYIGKKDASDKKTWLNKGTNGEASFQAIYNEKLPIKDRAYHVVNLIAFLKKFKNPHIPPDLSMIGIRYSPEWQDQLCKELVYNTIDTIKNKNHTPYINQVNLISKIGEVLAGEINRFITQRDETPKTRIKYNSETDEISILSRILPNREDLFSFLNSGHEIEKPVKGLYQALLTRLFLGDNKGDINLSNILINDLGTHYQTENIDFGNAFTANYSNEIKQIAKFGGEELLNMIEDFQSMQNNATKQQLLKHCDQLEIKKTLGKFANLKDQDLESLTNSLSKIKNKDGKELVAPKDREQFLKTLKNNRDVFAKAYEQLGNKEKDTQEFKEESNSNITTPPVNKPPSPSVAAKPADVSTLKIDMSFLLGS